VLRTYKLVGAEVKYILVPYGASLEDALKLLGLDKIKVEATLEAIS